MRRGTLIAGVGACLVLLLAWWGGANSKQFVVWYHTWQMNSGWRDMFSQPEVRTGNLIGYPVGEAWERYEKSREVLVDLGACRHARYQFQVLKERTPDRAHLVRRLIGEGSGTLEVAPPLYWEMSNSPSGFSTLEIWGRPDEVEALLADLKTHDVADYGDRFRKPSVLAEAQAAVQKWPTLGMWLPGDKEVKFFGENYDCTRDVLKREIRNPDNMIRGKALYVVQALEEKARDLGPDLVERLAADPAGQPDRSVLRALTAVRYRSPEGQRELSRHWDAAAASPKTALSIAAAQWVLSESAEQRQRAEAFLIRWLQPVPEGLSPSGRKAYLDTQWEAVVCVNIVPGLDAVEEPLERLLEKPAASWMRTQIPNSLNRIRQPADEAPRP